MKKNAVGTGKTIDDAINCALKELGIEDRDMVSIEVMENPKSGFLGMGGQDAKVCATIDISGYDHVWSYLKGIFDCMEADLDVSIEESENERGTNLNITVSGKDAGVAIGRRGENLDALQYLASVVANRGSESHIKVIIDTENYRAKREETLQRLAEKMAEKVIKYRRNMTLEPMSPYERRIIHSILQDYPGVTTYSTGAEPRRRVIVALKSDKQTTDK